MGGWIMVWVLYDDDDDSDDDDEDDDEDGDSDDEYDDDDDDDDMMGVSYHLRRRGHHLQHWENRSSWSPDR